MGALERPPDCPCCINRDGTRDHGCVLRIFVLPCNVRLHRHFTVTGIMDTRDACIPEAWLFDITSPFSPGIEALHLGSFFVGDPWGVAAVILSVLTNMAATILIAYRAWFVSSCYCECTLGPSLIGMDVFAGNTGT